MIRIACVLFALASISVLAGAAVAPALAQIGHAFPDSDPFVIRMIISLPALAVLPASFMTDSLCRRFGKKPVLLAGLALYLIGGCGAGMVGNISLLLILRGLLGIGMGLMTPVTHSLPGDFFQGTEREAIVSRMAAFVTMGAALCSILAGWLALISWRAAFMVYLVALPVALLVVVWLPNRKGQGPAPDQSPLGETGREPQKKLPAGVYLLGVSMLLYMSAFYVFPLCLADQLASAGVGEARFAGLLFALISLAGFLAGMYFPTCMKWLGIWLLPVLLFSLAAGSWLTAVAGNTVTALLGGLLAGFGLGLTPLHFVAVNASVPGVQLVRAMAVVVAGTFAGQFCSPFYIGLLEKMPLTGHGVFGENAALLLAACVLACGWSVARAINRRDHPGGK